MIQQAAGTTGATLTGPEKGDPQKGSAQKVTFKSLKSNLEVT